MTDDWLRERLHAVAEHRDRAAFTELFDRLAPRFKSLALARGLNERQADEIVQDAMLQVWTRAASYRPEIAGPMAWLFTIVRNKCTDLFRREGRAHAELSDVPDRADDERAGPEEELGAKRAADILGLALEVLTADQRAVVRKSFFEEKPHSVVAAELGIPLGTVKSRLRLAFARLRSELPESRP